MSIGTITTLGEETYYTFQPGHTKTVYELQTALAANGFPAKLAGRLPDRHAFVRAFRKWLTGLKGGEVNHSTSEYVEHITVDTKHRGNRKKGTFQAGRLTFQVDRAEVQNGVVVYQHYVTVTFDKKDKTITGTNGAIVSTIAMAMPGALDRKRKQDLTRLLKRVERHMIGNHVGTMPYGANLFVPAQHKPMIDRLLRFVVDIGGQVKLREPVYSFTPGTGGPTGASQAPAQVPDAVRIAVSDALEAKCGEAEDDILDLYRTEWTSEKRKNKKREECKKRLEDLAMDLNHYHATLSIKREKFNDLLAALTQQLQNPEPAKKAAAPPPVSYQWDDDGGEIEIVDAELPSGGGMAPKLCLFW